MNNAPVDYGFGEGIWGIIMLLIVAGLFSGNGFGWGENRGNVANDTLLGEEFIKRDIFNTNQNVSATSCQTQRDVLENRFNCSQNACATQKEILQNRYDNALQTQTLSSQIAQCCLMKIEATIREILCRFKNLIFGELLGI